MGISDMKNLSEDIVSSYDVRVKAIGTLVNNVHRTLKGFSTDRKKMANEQAKALKDFVNELSNSVGKMIEGIQKGHKEMADKLNADLAKGEEERLKGEEERLKGEEERLKDFKNMMADIQKAVKEIKTYVKNKLKEFSDAHADMSEELKKELAKYVNDLVNTTKELMGNNKKLMGNIQARQKERNAEVADLLEAFKTEREKMAANWQALTAKMAKKRGIKPEVEVEVKVRPVEEAVEEVVEEVEAEEVPPEISLEDRVLEFIERHPEGVRVGNMEDPLGVTKLRLGKIAKSLLNEGKVRKEDNLYFPL